jgi:transposase-like protein
MPLQFSRCHCKSFPISNTMPPHVDDGDAFFQLARVTIQQARFAIQEHPEERERITGHHERIERLLTAFLRLHAARPNSIVGIEEWIEVITDLRMAIMNRLQVLRVYDYNTDTNIDDDVIPATIIPCITTETGGRPKFVIDWEMVLAYRQQGYQWTEIAQQISISPRTLQRRRLEENIPELQPFSTISEVELDQVVRNIIQQSAGVIGSQFLQSAMLDIGLRVQRRRVRESLARVDPLGNFNRWATLIPRSVYSVAGPNQRM